MIGVLVAAQALAVVPAFASTKGHMNTAAALSAAAVYTWYRYGNKHNTGNLATAALTTGAAGYAWSQYSKSKKSDKKKQMAQAYSRGLAASSASRSRYGTRAYQSRYRGTSSAARQYRGTSSAAHSRNKAKKQFHAAKHH